MPTKPLKLRAEDDEDLSIISAALQDAAVPIEHVGHVRRRGFDPKDSERILALLAVTAGEGIVDLVFSGDAGVRLEVDRLDCRLDDFGEPWPTIFRPGHEAN